MNDMYDLAIVGAGATGTYVAEAVSRERPDRSIVLFERSDRIGGRLRSVRIPGIGHPIELGGMRYLTSHRHVQAVVDAFGLATHPFVEGRGPDRFYLRGHFSDGPADPRAGAGYDLVDGERGRSAGDLIVGAFERIVPGATQSDDATWAEVRAERMYEGRPLTDWSIGDALATVLSPEAHRFVRDAFGYDSGLSGFNAGDAIQYLVGAGDPTAQARVPDEGMAQMPGALAAAFLSRGGTVALGHELVSVDSTSGGLHLSFANGATALARQVVLTLTLPAYRMLAAHTSMLQSPAYERLFASVDAWQAAKLYLWYDRPWWRDGFQGVRTTTDRTARKLFYFDGFASGPAAMLATYTDGRHSDPWRDLAGGPRPGTPATPAMLEVIDEQLRVVHPAADVPAPIGSAFVHWGGDPHETGWHFWRRGTVSDDVLARLPQIDPSVELYVGGEAFSRAQGWVEGAFESAAAVVARLGARSS